MVIVDTIKKIMTSANNTGRQIFTFFNNLRPNYTFLDGFFCADFRSVISFSLTHHIFEVLMKIKK